MAILWQVDGEPTTGPSSADGIIGPHDREGPDVISETVHVLLIGLEPALSDELAADDGFIVVIADDPSAAAEHADVEAVVVALDGSGPLETLGSLRTHAPDAAVLVVTSPDRQADGAVAIHAGAEDHLVTDTIPPGLLPRAIRYAVAHRRLRHELSTQDEATGLPNLRGFATIAEHHLRMADRSRARVVFLFMQLEDYVAVVNGESAEAADQMARDAAEVLLDAVRDSDLPARIAPDTFCVLLTGDAAGAETLVLSRLVEAIAMHDARRDRPRELSLSVGSALYDPEHPGTLEQILQTAGRRLGDQRRIDSSGRS